MRAVSHIERLLSPRNGTVWGTRPEDFDAGLVENTIRRIGKLFGPGRYFPLDVRGFERVPEAPALIVSNHSGGTTIPDAWGFMMAWYRHFGVRRPAHILAHDMVLANGVTGRYFAQRGVIRAERRLAARALSHWRRDVLVMPGGDLETWRPYSKRYRVCFGARTGYAWLALRAQVPIVPVANAGAHETLLVLSDGRRIAEALRIPMLARASVFPVHLSLPWGLTIGPWPHIPIPRRLRYRVGRPISVPHVPEDREPTRAEVLEVDAEVRAAIQSLLDELEAEDN